MDQIQIPILYGHRHLAGNMSALSAISWDTSEPNDRFVPLRATSQSLSHTRVASGKSFWSCRCNLVSLDWLFPILTVIHGDVDGDTSTTDLRVLFI